MDSEDIEEIRPEIKDDIKLGFDLFKNDNNKINKLKLRTMLFCFCMYKGTPQEINDYIEKNTSPDQELFSFEEVCKLINFKNKIAKEKEADEMYAALTNQGKTDLTDVVLKKAFQENQINISTKEVQELMKFMNAEKIENYDDEDEAKEEEKAKETLKSTTKTAKGKTVTKKEKPKYFVEKENLKNFYTVIED